MEEVEKNKPQKSDPSDSNTKPQSKPGFFDLANNLSKALVEWQACDDQL